MEKRYFLFALLSAVILIGYIGAVSMFGPERQPPAAEVPADDLPPDEAPQDSDAAQAEDATESSAASETSVGEATDTAVAPESTPEVPLKWVTLGSAAGSPVPYLATFTNRGAALERLELTARSSDGQLRFRDVFAESGYLGQLQLADATDGGVEVRVVGEDTPAANAVAKTAGVPDGLQVGDVVTALNESPVASLPEWNDLFSATRPGDEVTLSVERTSGESTQKLQFTAKLTEHPLAIVAPEVPPVSGQQTPDPLSLLLTIAKLGSAEGKLVNVDDAEAANRTSLADAMWEVRRIESPAPGVEFQYTLTSQQLADLKIEGQWQIIKRYTLPAPNKDSETPTEPSYHLNLEIAFRNLGEQPQRIAYRLTGPNGLPNEGWWYQSKIHPQMMASAGARDVIWDSEAEGHRLLGGPKIYANAQKAEKDNKPIVTSIVTAGDAEPRRTMKNVGVDTQYFVVSLIPGTRSDPKSMLVDELDAMPVSGVLEDFPKAKIRSVNISFALVSPTYTVPSQGEVSQSFVLFAGPKEADVLASYGLSEAIEYGWPIFELFARPLMAVLHLFYAIVGNYGLAIIMLTLLVRACMLPVSRKAAKSAAKMQELAPELKKISEKYKDDIQKQRQAQQELYRKHSFNPFGSCLLMFLQLPVFIGLYRCLSIDIALRQAPLIPGVRWASNLAAPDMLFRWDSYLPDFFAGEGTGWLGPYFNVLPVITILLFVLQQKMFTPPPTDEQQKAQQQMMTFMMIFMGVLFFRVPSGLCVYFIVSSLWGITERKLLPKSTPPADSQKKTDEPVKSKWSLTRDGKNGSSSKPSQRRKQKRR